MNLFVRKNIVLCLLWSGWVIGLVGYVFYDCIICLLFVPVLFFLVLLFMLIKTMFKKKVNSNNNEISSATNVPLPGNSPVSNPSQDLTKTNTIIASGTQLKGNVDLEGDIQIYGVVIGDITVTEGTIRLMRSGNIEGNLTAPHITIDGRVDGVCVSDHLEILEHGRLKGIVKGTNFSIKKGGVFIGQSEISEEPNNARGKTQQNAASSVERKKSKERAITDPLSDDILANA
ncbi:polymer-forming cytoskeletal protein [Candidatus Fukatsuia symbiotica]|uniref:Polymer-forming cytoskeletal protein n=1 Tax=Candidatus Fukatsuia symbiotica TaxID=1878942 RepID=A0A2U8I7U4_9GAMM|nr:polymer-forming cytoskeletal protein [Candidatus Fukatsuia symbiotica]AWK15246.1 hypothetical protein CCS41_13410 [Candidatus Fukatsuia symbiotica]MEA9444079.1 polymer-forming cytoskeletal protein [Candidatus Fukatsuia symbiotica]